MADNGSRPKPEELILYEKDPKTKIATITFNRPEYLNAPTSAARLRYADLLRAATVDNDVKVVVIRGVGDNLGSGADLPEFMEGNDNTDLRLAELRLEDEGVGEVSYPPKGSFRHGATISAWYANVQAGNRPLQELKKISIVEAKGYCYGWHFYQCADADLVISSDDALFGHPSFRYYGWGPRMWTWVQMMGLRKFQEMVFTGRPFTAEEMYQCNFLNKVVARDQLEAEVDKYARACARNRPVDTVFQQKIFFEVFKQYQGEYMGSLLSAFFESMGSGVAERRHGRPGHVRGHRQRAGRCGQRQRQQVPAGLPAEQVEPQEEGLRRRWHRPLNGYVVVDLSTRDRRRLLHQAAGRRRRRGHQSRSRRRVIRCGGGRRRVPRSTRRRRRAVQLSGVLEAQRRRRSRDRRRTSSTRCSPMPTRWCGRAVRAVAEHAFAPAEIHRAHPHLTVTAITPFGLDGPWRDRPATEFTLQAWSGGIVGPRPRIGGPGTGIRRRPGRRVPGRGVRQRGDDGLADARRRGADRPVDAGDRRSSASPTIR